MKKILLCAVAAAISLLSFVPEASAQATGDRNKVLKIYNWADYIDEDLLTEFKEWYKEQTGEEIEIIYQLFDINEIMLAKIEKGHEDFDIACPSEYIIERMLAKDLLLPLDRNFGETPDYTQNMSPFLMEKLANIKVNGKSATEYAVPYMWGTVGILYNPKYVTEEEASSWDIMWNPKFKNKILVKDAFRDVYSPLLIYEKQDELAAGKVTIEELMYDSSDESIALIEKRLKTIKQNIAGWEADFGKEMMTKESVWINLSWSGDAMWAIEEASAIGVELAYTVPQEGSLVWYDGWVIPKYAKNIKAANYFINFMSMPENALRNMDATGYVSATGGNEILAAMTDQSMTETVDATYFFGEGAEAVKVNPVMYPDKSVIERCGVMHDSGDRTEAMLEMWSRVKGDNLGSWVYVLIAIIVLLVILALLKKQQKQMNRRRRGGRRQAR